MTGGRRPRPLTSEERALWVEVAKGIAPLKGRAPLLDDPDPPAAPARADPEAPAPRATPPAPARVPAPKGPPPPAPLVPLDRKLRLQLRRGRKGVDAVIDLHGLTQDAAHRALIAFLHGAQADGASVVMVVTGKGARSGAEAGADRGVLHRSVPHWLRLPALRPLVLGFDEAGPRQGGAGALYVRLRRPGRMA